MTVSEETEQTNKPGEIRRIQTDRGIARTSSKRFNTTRCEPYRRARLKKETRRIAMNIKRGLATLAIAALSLTSLAACGSDTAQDEEKPNSLSF